MFKYRRNGFTLVELMVVIVIIGILASLASFGFLQYVKKSKTAEASEFLRQLSNGSRIYFTSNQRFGGDEEFWHTGGSKVGYPVPGSERVFPGGDGWSFTSHTSIPKGGVKLLPDSIAKVMKDGASRSKSALNKLNFTVRDPTYFQYSYLVKGKGNDSTATCKAIADFDGDGSVFHTVTQVVKVKKGEVLSGQPYTENEFK